MGNAGKRAVSGAAAGAATGALGSKINNSLAKAAETGTKTLLSRAGSNAIVRGALTGAVGGATSGGVSTLMNGGDLGQMLGNMVSSGLSGGLQGGVSGGAMNAVGKIGNKTTNKIQNNVIEPIWTKQQNKHFENAIANPESIQEPVYLGKITQGKVDELNNAFDIVDTDRAAKGLKPIDRTGVYIENDGLYLTKDGAQHIHDSRIIGDSITPSDVTKTMRKATGDNSVVVPNYRYPRNATMGSMDENGMANLAHITGRNGNANLETVYATDSGATYDAIKKHPVGAESTSTTNGSLPARRSALRGANSSISQDANAVNAHEPFESGYGHSVLAQQSKSQRNITRAEKIAQDLEGAQTNITREQARKLGIKNVGEVIENVRKKTGGITDIEKQAEFAKTLTGGKH